MTDATTFDLDAATTTAPDWSLEYAGETFAMLGDLPLEAFFALGDFGALAEREGLEGLAALAELRDVARALFRSEDDYARFMSLRPTAAHLVALLSEASRRSTGAGLGESSGPDGSSSVAEVRSSQTSNGSTGSTSTE